LADLDELVPPACAPPVSPQNIVIFIFLEDTLSAEVEYVEKRMIVEDVDRSTRRRAEFTHTLTKKAGGGRTCGVVTHDYWYMCFEERI
jgi:hypothetical protein